ncbi:MAG: hypothetical protein ILP09_09175, partial [Oscillospiraceae bacterium]|nr:hypothetical protein [Oscillospiraceae bacterium]
MKKTIIAVLVILMLVLTACGHTVPDTGTANDDETARTADTWRNVTEAEAKELFPNSFDLPEGAENAIWSVTESAADPSGVPGAMLRLTFELNGITFTAKQQRTDDKNADPSGMQYSWTAQESSALKTPTGGSIPCRTYRYIGEDETVDHCVWYDEGSGASCSVSAAAKDSDGFDLRAIAEAMLPSSAPSAEEQKSILEANRSLWAFDDGQSAPDWYYAFTDLDRNGLLEVISASTQGSGIFTYARFYEVLPDGSGVKNLYHADMEIEGPDDWPEIILESIPCYYDSASNLYHYVCTNTLRDGAFHSVTQLAALCLKDGKAEWETIASMDVQRTEDGELSSYSDGAGNPISEQNYQNAVEYRFAGMARSELKPEWIPGTKSPSGPEREDGERFETVIQIEGMDETVRYEHLRSRALGIEMDYDYESFVRLSEADRERFISVWDADTEAPVNYLDVTYSPEDAETVAASFREKLSREYDLLETTRELDRAGSCIRIEASELKGSGLMADLLQVVYIVPASDGCRVAEAHYAIEAAEGFGRRFSAMINTLSVIERSGPLSDEQALAAVRKYCLTGNPD